MDCHHTPSGGLRSIVLFLVLVTSGETLFSQDLGETYIEGWKKFYPSRAVDRGFHSSIFNYETLSQESIRNWVALNETTLDLVSDEGHSYVRKYPVDARLLRIQTRSEIEKWTNDKPHETSLSMYSNLIAAGVNSIYDADYLLDREKKHIICKRLDAIRELCTNAMATLLTVKASELERSLVQLEKTEASLRNEWSGKFSGPQMCPNITERVQMSADRIDKLILHVRQQLRESVLSSGPVLGREEYGRQLRNYTDTRVTPEEMSQMALDEINLVNGMIEKYSREYLLKTYGEESLPDNAEEIIQMTFRDMENDAPENGKEYLKFWLELSESARRFLIDKKIATLPSFETLQIVSAPESAGAAARIGWVDSAPPFAPNPVTTLYLPSIPDSFPDQEKKDFWSSFNKPFNRMIVIHELYPGHYMQIKISRETPHILRLLFPYRPYIEGWATFTERVCLDMGWEAENPLTFLAHLRKRLENANRAYMSVQVHCNGWSREQVMQFSTETSLLAPQFAKSLWGRIMRSPMQLTSYYWGGAQFTALLASEKDRLGDEFRLQDFMDSILKAGAIPVDEFEGIFTN